MREKDYDDKRFLASLQGIDMGDSQNERKEIERRARLRREGKTDQDAQIDELASIGIQIINE